jgi:hypothetical protein
MNRIEEWWQSADDGASAPVGPLETRDEAEFDGLLDAWYLERRNCIECEILLEQSRVLIARLMAELDASPNRKRQARRLIRAIDQTLRAVDARDD